MENKPKKTKWKNLAIAVLAFAVPTTFLITKCHYNSKLEAVSERRDAHLKTANKYASQYKEAIGWLINSEARHSDNLIEKIDGFYSKDSLTIE